MGERTTTSPDEATADGERRKAFTALAKASADGILMVDDQNHIRYANPAVKRILGYAPADLIGSPLLTLIPDHLQHAHTTAFHDYLDTGEKHLDWTYIELPAVHKAGHEVPLGISFGEFTHEGDRYFVGMLRDISEQQQAKQRLQESKQQLRALIRVLPVGVFVAEQDGRLVEVNETAKEIWGGEIADAESVDDYDQYTGWWPETGDPVDPDEWPLARALNGEEITEPELIEIEGFDGEHRMVLHYAMPIRDADGEVTRAVITILDVTDREERKQQLERQNERLDRFASMLAHELRNPLEVAQIYLDFVEDGDDSTITQIADALERIDEIIEVLLMLARTDDDGTRDAEPVGLTGVAKDAWTNIETGDSKLQVRTTEVVRMNRTHLQHLFENLFRNSIEHSEGAVTVRVGTLEGEDGFYVEDTGPGIPVSDRDRVMEAGYTTDTDGIGLGLTFIAELADAYKWQYQLTESDDGGTRIEFTNVKTVTDQ